MRAEKKCETCKYFEIRMFHSNGKCSIEYKCTHKKQPGIETCPKNICDKWEKIDLSLDEDD